MTDDSIDRPNVLMIVTDQHRWDTVGAHGSPMDLTPNIDQLAAEGLRFDNAVTPQPVCGSSQSVIHTGRYATETGVWRHSLPLADGERTLAHYFAENGYETGFVGSWHLAGTFDEPVPASHRGGYEDFWIGADVPEFMTQPTEGMLFDENGEPVTFDKYRADAFADFAIDAIETLSEPFFLMVGFLEPHDQNDQQTFVAPERYAERYRNNPYVPPDLRDRPGNWFNELPDYYGAVERIDECIGRLTDTLARTGARDETIVAFTSDHGCHFRSRPGEYKRTCHDASVHVPAVLHGPGIDAGRVVEQTVSLVDWAPTILDAAGNDVPESMHGHSLLDDDHPRMGEAFIQLSGSEIGRAIRTDRWKLGVSAPTLTGWRGGKAEKSSDHYVERYLYNLARDPAEQVNLVGRPEYRAVFERLRDRLLEYIRDVEGEDPTIDPVSNPGYQDY
ncbi:MULTISPECIES: sulfatase-like hydrolase/transferase [unclassified Haloferax]|uniref:sulfatase-like hydrolase/transferase n=1 Tax=unclassified Haloferax TaxID=2625095 RepID=UPI000B285661|nr:MULTISPECIES: sulfatase-like hydrolase/transferase [unclassified Haloferax]